MKIPWTASGALIAPCLASVTAITAITAITGPAHAGDDGPVNPAPSRRFVVPSISMEPTLPFRSAFRVGPKNAPLRRGDIVVYNRAVPYGKPGKPGKAAFVTRVVGLPGDTVSFSGTNVWVNGRKLSQSLVRQTADSTIYRESSGAAAYTVAYQRHKPGRSDRKQTIVVPQKHLFTLGDNRDNARDSRFTGPLPVASVVGLKAR